ncbi:MAG TPA: DUF4271 domain-containing protein [Mucilaginibacter sp.]|jgi:hypothetical protein|nr:DUF4271 domain-containing protein [Mucilaginibacter sp.]
MRFIAACILFSLILTLRTFAQQDTASGSQKDTSLSGGRKLPFLDSVAIAMQKQQQQVQDSLTSMYIRPADSLRHDQLVDSLLKLKLYTGTSYLDIHVKSKSLLKEGSSRPSRDRWVLSLIIALLLYTAVLNRVMSKDVGSVWSSFYSKRALNQMSKEDNLINSWAFVALFLLFALTFGLFLYQFSAYRHVYYTISGFPLFISLTIVILVLFAVKFLLVKFIGFVFNIHKLVTEYLSVSYLTYINIAFVFLPVGVCFSLLTDSLIPYVLWIAFILIAAIFVWQYLRGSVEIISNILFHKFYLIVYLCALEICPVLILVKALKI